MTTLAHPLYYMIVKREGTSWHFKPGSGIFHNPRNVPTSLQLEDRLHRFKLKLSTVMVEMFRLNGGRAGYYLANLKDKKYYYCGLEWNDVRTKLLALGVGRQDPMDKL